MTKEINSKSGKMNLQRSQNKKKLEIQRNQVKGIDLLIEKDAGNTVYISTGRPDASLAFWKELLIYCETAIETLESN